MKKYFLILMLMLSVSGVNADNLYQNTNPFPQTSPQTMNNIYESVPAVMIKEEKKAKKTKIKAKNAEEDILKNMPAIPVYPVPHEGTQEEKGNFYMFTTGQ